MSTGATLLAFAFMGIGIASSSVVGLMLIGPFIDWAYDRFPQGTVIVMGQVVGVTPPLVWSVALLWALYA